MPVATWTDFEIAFSAVCFALVFVMLWWGWRPGLYRRLP